MNNIFCKKEEGQKMTKTAWEKLSKKMLKEAKMGSSKESIDKQILMVQNSTKTTIGAFCPIHDKLRMKYYWYYKWHLNPWAARTHLAALGVYAVALLMILANFSGLSLFNFAKAASFTSVKTGNWSDQCTWSAGCNSGVPGAGDSVTVNTGHTVTLTGTTTLGTTGDLTIKGTLVTGNNTFTVKSLTVNTGATLTAGATSTIKIAGNFTQKGTFTPSTGTVEFNGVSSNQNLTPGITFYNVIHSGASALTQFPYGAGGDDYGGSITVNGNFNQTNGDFGFNNFNIAGNVTVTGGGVAGRFGEGTINVNGTTAATYSAISAFNFADLFVNKTDTSNPSVNNKVTFLTDVSVMSIHVDSTSGSADTIDISDHTLTINGDDGYNGPSSFSSLIKNSNSTIKFVDNYDSGYKFTIPTNVHYPNLILDSNGDYGDEDSGFNFEFVGAAHLYVDGNLELANGSFASPSGMTVGGDYTIGSDTTISYCGSERTYSVGGNWANYGTFYNDVCSLDFTKASGTQTFIEEPNNGVGYTNINHSGAGTLMISSLNGADIGGTMHYDTLTASEINNLAGTFDANDFPVNFTTLNNSAGTTYKTGTGDSSFETIDNSGTIEIEISGNVDDKFHVDSDFYHRDGSTIKYTGSGSVKILSDYNDYYNVEFDHAETIFAPLAYEDNFTSYGVSARGNMSITSGTLDLHPFDFGMYGVIGGSIRCNGNFSIANGATYIKGGYFQTWGASTTNLYDGNAVPNDLGELQTSHTVNLTSNIKVTSISNYTDNVNAFGVLNLGSNNTLTITGSGSQAYTGSGVFNKGTNSTVVFAGTSATPIPALAYNNLSVTGATTYTLGGNLTGANALSGNLTIGSGATLSTSASNYGITLAGNWSNAGTFTPGTGTVTFKGTGQSTLSGPTTFNNLVMNATTDGAKTIVFPTGSGNKQIINGTWTIDGDSGKVITLRSATPGTAWYFQVGAAFTAGDYINITDSYSANAYKITKSTNYVDGGNNDGWIFNFAPTAPTSLGPVGLVDGDWATNKTPTLTFNLADPDTSDQVKYEIVISANSNFSSPIVDYTSSLGAQGARSYTVSPALADGTYFWRVKTIDAGNLSSGWTTAGVAGTADIKIDTTNPVTDIHLDPAEPTGTNGYYKGTAPTVWFTGDDGTGSGFRFAIACWGNSGDCNAEPNPFAMPDGVNTLNYYGVDNAGYSTGQPTYFSRTIKVDTTIPTATATASPSGPNGSNNYFVGVAPTITLNAEDEYSSGVLNIKYKWDNGSYATYTTGIVAPEGVHTLYYYATDNAGNDGSASPYSTQYSVDLTAPTVNVAANPVTPNGTNSYYIDAAPTITLSAADTSGSGVTSIKYKWDSASYATYTTPLTASAGTHTLYYYSVDAAGNNSEESNQIYKVDLTKPVADIYADPASPDGANDYYTTSPTITLGATDANGIAHIFYHWDSADDSTYTTAITALEGHHTISYHAVDNAGNASLNVTRDYYVDSQAPTASVTSSPASASGANGYYKGTAPTITLAGSDSGSGLANIKYRWGNSGDYLTYSTALTAPEGTNTLYYYATDRAGNSGEYAVLSQEYKVDTANPVVDIAANPSSTNGAADWYKASAPTVTLSSSDVTSGPSTIYYRWGTSGEYSIYGSALTAPEGTNTIYYYGVDNAGNSTIATPVTRQYKVDSAAPLSFTPTVNPADWTKTNSAAVTFATTDATSTVDHYEVKVDDGQYSALTSPSTLDTTAFADGVHTVSVKALDHAGNERVATSSIKIDRTGPAFSAAPAVTSPTNKLAVNFYWNKPNDLNDVTEYAVSIGSEAGKSDIKEDQITTETKWTETFSTFGTYYIRVKAKDALGTWGNYSAESSVLIDMDPPAISISELTDQQFISAKTFSIKGISSDKTAGVDYVEIAFDSGTWNKADSKDDYANWTYDWKDYSEGLHAIVARAVGKAGNITSSIQYAVIVDTTAPSVPADFRGFNVSNSPAQVFATYLDFAGSTDDTSGVKSYELWKGDTKLADIPIAKDTTNANFTGNANQPYFYVDSGLASSKYSYKIKATDVAGNVSETPEISIDTSGKAVEADNLTEAKGTPSSVVTKEKTSAIVTWKTVYPATSSIEYGTTASYGSKTDVDNSLNQGHSVLLSDLKPATTYHAKVKSRDLYGKDLESADFTFTTKQAPEDQNVMKVIISALQSLFKSLTVGAADSQPTAATLESLQGFSNNLLLTDISFKDKGYYGNILTFEKGKKVERSSDGKNYSALTSATDNYLVDKDVKEGTSYYYRIDAGAPITRKPVVGDDTALTIKDASVIKESVQTSTDKAQLTISWATNRGATSQVEFGTSNAYGQKTKEDASLNMGHNIILENLSPDTTYHFKATSKDSKGNIVSSEDFTFQTPSVAKEKTPIDTIFESFQRVFNSIRGVFQ